MADLTTRERLARGLAKYDWSCETPDFEDFWRMTKDEYLPRIDDILDELMEPSDEALSAGFGANQELGIIWTAAISDQDRRNIWQAILTHIKDGKEALGDG